MALNRVQFPFYSQFSKRTYKNIMELRPYQKNAKQQIYNAFREGKQSVMLQLPTGAGKTILFSSIVNDGHAQERRTLILAHRGELLQQAADKLNKGFGIRCGVIMAGYPTNQFCKVQVASVQTLVNRKLLYAPNICIIDEAHHVQSKNTYGKIRDYILSINPNCKFLGVTATPCRTNGAGFKDIFDVLIQGTSIAELIKLGNLSPARYFVAPLDLGKIKVTAGDYNQKELSAVYQDKVHAENLVQEWKKLANNKKTIGFAVDIEHSKTIVAAFQKEGIIAKHIDGGTRDIERNKAVRDFAEGKIKVLYNVGIFDEGFDSPSAEVVQLARPSKSLIKYMQMCGRVLRPFPGKEYALVLDHSGLIAEHGLIETDRDWTLDGVTKRESNTELKFKDKLTGKTYKPDQLPMDIPMERIELVELTKELMDNAAKMKLISRWNELHGYCTDKGYKPFWIWYQMAKDVRIKSESKAREQLRERAIIFCNGMGYHSRTAIHLVNEYIEKNKSQFTKE